MLTIYSASAGTGKTHTLTGEYIKLLFGGSDRHRRILAVTFTNKATAEMKGRVIEELSNLAEGRPSDYVESLSDGGRLSEQEVRIRAKQILIAILHDYSAFNISTIDHFFQHTIRAFTREIGLQGNYQIELDAELLLEEAVDKMFMSLERQENKALLTWLLCFIDDQIENGKNWDIQKDVIALGKELFKETYKKYGDEIGEDIQKKEFLGDYRKELDRIVQSKQCAARELGEKGVSLFKKSGLKPSDLKDKGRSQFYMFEHLARGEMKEPTKTFKGFLDNLDGWCARTADKDIRNAAKQLYDSGLNEVIREIMILFNDMTDYKTAREIDRNFFALGILTDLSKHISEWREENNKMLIADTTELLNKVIGGSDVPFIYEKTGTRVEHYMIDEFQDTSGMQWANFRPLLKDSLDSGMDNLIVGDVKQSIYRFRNSDWTLLDNCVKEEFTERTIEKSLEINWRSCRHIVECNNRLFSIIPQMLQSSYNQDVEQSSLSEQEKRQYQSKIVSAYRNATQQVSTPFQEKEGHVSFTFLKGDDEKTWKDQSMSKLPHIIKKLEDNGYEPRDIAILTRTGAEGLMAAQTLLKYKESQADTNYQFDVISEDSLTIESSLSVRWIISMLRYASQPENDGYRCLAQMAYAVMLRKKHEMETDFVPDETPFSIKNYFMPFPSQAIHSLRQLQHRSLYELTEGIYRLFEDDFPNSEQVFIQALLDLVSDFSSNGNADINRFLDWWDETGKSGKIVTPETQNAIRIMTIHKSKGLGFRAVIIPFCDWKIDKGQSIIWCHPSKKPFNRLHLVPIRYSKGLKDTIFAKDYFNERLNASMDNLNTLYVAFTRAKEELIVLAPQKSRIVGSVSNFLREALQDETKTSDDAEGVSYEYGEWWKTSGVSQDAIMEEFRVGRLYSLSPDERMQLRMNNHRSIFDKDDKRRFGIVVHDILKNILTAGDVDSVISGKCLSGEINAYDVEVIKNKIIAMLDENAAKHWFDGSMKVMNETDILFGNGQSRRPDRIMIAPDDHVIVVDYKLGDNKEITHIKQVESYISLLREMGFLSVEGYLWYLSLNKLEKVFF